MIKFTRLIHALGLLSIAYGNILEGQGVSFLWTNADNNGHLDDNNNWTPFGIPIPGDTAVFDTAPGTHTLSVATLPNFLLGTAQFTNTSYTINLVTTPNLNFIFEEFSVLTPGDVNGVVNLTSLTQTFNLSDSNAPLVTKTIQFMDSSSANYQPTAVTGEVVYNITQVNPTANVSLQFQNTSSPPRPNTSTASNATINLIAANSLYPNLIFSDNSTAATANITAPHNTPSNNALIQFNGASDPSNATIALHDSSTVDFSTTTKSSNGGPFITLFDSAVVNINTSNRISSLNSNSTAAQVNIGTETLTIKTPSNENDLYAGQLNGTGVFNYSGINNNSTLTLTGDNCSNFTGTTNVRHGQLFLDGTLGGKINVFSILSGTGTACNTVDVKAGGVIFPGDDAIGTLTVGHYINRKNGTYLTLVNGSGDSSLIDATRAGTNGSGTITLDGGTVFAASSNGTYLINTPYLIAHADEGRTGKYTNAVQDINPFLVADLSYTPKNVFLTLQANFEGFAETHNQEEVAEAIDCIQSPTGVLQEFLHTLASLTPSQLRHALDDMSGEQYTSIFPTFQKANERFIHGLDLTSRLTLQDPCNYYSCDCYEIWGDVQYGRSYIRGDDNAKGYKQQNINGFLATQMKVGCNTKVGAAVYYENDILRFHLNGKARNNIVLGSVFGVYSNPRFYFLSDFMGGYFHGNYRRHIAFDDINFLTRAHPRGYSGTYYGEVGSTFYECCGVSVQPFLGAEGGWYHVQSFEEDGGSFLSLHGKNQNYITADSFLGLRLNASACGVEITGEAAWQHSYTAWGNHIMLQLDQFCDAFKITGPKQSRDGIVGSFTVALEAYDKMSIYAEVSGEKWEHYSTYSFGLGIDVLW